MAEKETSCPNREDGTHCNCWYDGEPCCSCQKVEQRIAELEGENERLGSALYRIQCDRCSQAVGGYIETPEDGPLGSIIVPARFCPLCAAGRMPRTALAPKKPG